ncbi:MULTISPECIES: hypothetical protein [unclassified Thalassospira]|uniref:hypothetical protein n=1 Tax=unclassified Thalassospira TaxID=2648997 RepID=UPI001B1E058A|nr:hypothetical protein [Thalassospira sp.]MBO6769747.1 hypothetical protein [Thalassospira sp.]
MFEFVIGVVLLVPMFVMLRVLPILGDRYQGCDAYNILLNAEAFRKSWKLPIVVEPELFVLERPEQWYPPGFIILCALIPKKILNKYFWVVNHIVDCVSALVLYGVAVHFGAGVPLALLFALLYGISAGLVIEFSALNVRPFGLLLFNVLMCLSYAGVYRGEYDSILLFLLLLVCVLLFFSHKLSLQQLWFTLPVVSFMTMEFEFILIVLAIYCLPFVIWPSGARRIVVGHWNIVLFWARNWKNLGAHIVRQSPVYGGNHNSTSFYDQKNEAGAIGFLKNTLHQNYFLFPFIVIFVEGNYGENQYFLYFLSAWVSSVYILGFSVHFFKCLRGIGLGRQYFKFSLFPALCGCAIGISGESSAFAIGLTICCAILTCRQYLLILRTNMKRSNLATEGAADNSLRDILHTIAEDGEVCVMCFPVHLCDFVAYKTQKRVYWGTHSDVFDVRLEQFFPVLKKDLSYYVKDGVNRLLLDSRYVAPEELRMKGERLLMKSDAYYLYDISTIQPLEKV